MTDRVRAHAGLPATREAVRAKLAAVAAGLPAPSYPLPDTPFVGLVPFGPADAPFFFGRERERRLIAANLMASRLTLLYGASGVGKSSVLRAGVEHDLRALARRELVHGRVPEWIPLVFASWRDDPLRALREEIIATLAATLGPFVPESPAAERFDEFLAALIVDLDVALGGDDDDRRIRLLIVLDQFEEYFLYHGDDDREGTIAVELPRAINREGLRVNFAISIREDAYAQLDRFKGRILNLFESYLRIRHLDRDAARRAVTLPVAAYNEQLPEAETPFAIEDELVEAVLDEVKAGTVVLGQVGGGTVGDSSELRVEAPFLQLVMRRLWLDARARGDRHLALSGLRKLGGADHIVRAHLHEAMEQLDPNERDIAARVFHQLVTPSGTKIAHTLPDLGDYAGVDDDDLLPMLEKLARARILRPIDPPPGESVPRFEIFHDVLGAAVLEWRAAHVREQEEAVRRRDDRRRLLTRFRAVVGVLLALGSVATAALAVWALMQRSDAVNARAHALEATRSASALALASAARAQIDEGHTDVSLLLALEAYKTRRSAETASAMVAALEKARRSGAEAILRADPAGGRSVAFSPDGRTLAYAGGDGTVRLWDVIAHDQLGQPLHGHVGRVWTVAFSPDGRTLASAGSDGRVVLWDVRTRKSRGILRVVDKGRVRAVALSSDGRALASGSDDGTVRLWDTRTRVKLGGVLGRHKGAVLAVAFTPDGRKLASGGRDGTVRLWDVRTRKPLDPPLHAHRAWVWSIAFTTDGNTLATVAGDGTVRLWDVRRRRSLGAPLRGHRGWVWSVAISRNGRTLASAGDDGTVRLWDVRTRKPLNRPLRGHAGAVWGVAFGRGDTLASTGDDGAVRLWNTHTLRRLGEGFAGQGDVSAVQFSARGRTVVADIESDLVLWDVRTRKRVQWTVPSPSFIETFSADGRTLAVLSEDSGVAAWDVRTHKELGGPPRGGGIVVSAALNGDGGKLALTYKSGTLRLWDVHARRLVGRPMRGPRTFFGGSTYYGGGLAISSKGKILATASGPRDVQLWDIRTYKPLGQPLHGHSGFVWNIAFSSDGRMLASASGDGTVRLWDVRTHKPLGQPLRGHTGTVVAVAFTPDGGMVASGGLDGTVRLWDVRTHKPLGQPLRASASTSGVSSLAFSPDGRSFASGGHDGRVRLWEGILWRKAADLKAAVCTLVVGNLTRVEWAEFAPGLAYRTTC